VQATDPLQRLQSAENLLRAGSPHADAVLAPLRGLEQEFAEKPALLERLAGVYQDIGYIDRAYSLLQRAYQAEPENPAILLRMAYVDMFLGYPAPIQERIQKVMQKAPQESGPYVTLALYHDRNRRPLEAEKALKQARTLSPNSMQVRLLLSQNLTEQRRFEEAEKVIEEMKKIAPQEARIIQQQAFVAQERARAFPEQAPQHLMTAQSAVEKFLQIEPENPSAWMTLGQILRDRGDNAGAKNAWERAHALDPHLGGLLIPFGQLLLRIGERERGQKLMIEGRKRTEEDDEFNKRVNQLSADFQNSERRRALARWCTEKGRIARGILEWERLLEQVKGDTEAQKSLEKLRKQRGDENPPP
jgi:predicted Zn-dependent protease